MNRNNALSALLGGALLLASSNLFALTPESVPEPETMLLLALAVPAAIVASRRKK